jgi:hypothetical protein
MIFGLKKLTKKAFFGVLGFTVIETVILSVWLELLFPGLHAHAMNAVAAVIVLFVGLFVEHYIATQVGQQDK